MSDVPAGSGSDAAAYVASVVIPAYNEEKVIGRCIEALRAERLGGPLEIVVAANGCHDNTAAVARSFPGVTVLDIPVGSKILALNLGDEAATAFPRIYLDADIVLTGGALASMVDLLTTDAVRVAAPSLQFETSGGDWVTRAYHDVFTMLPSATDTLIGRGVYGLSRAARARFDVFPELQGDDLFVGRLYGPEERVVAAGQSVVQAPRSASDLVKQRTRVARGNAELAARAAAGDIDTVSTSAPPIDFGSSTRQTLTALGRLAARRPALLPKIAAYAGITVAARRRARSAPVVWDRDASTR